MQRSKPQAFGAGAGGSLPHEPDADQPQANLTRKFLVTLEPDETGMLVAECPAIPGCVSQAQTES